MTSFLLDRSYSPFDIPFRGSPRYDWLGGVGIGDIHVKIAMSSNGTLSWGCNHTGTTSFTCLLGQQRLRRRDGSRAVERSEDGHRVLFFWVTDVKLVKIIQAECGCLDSLNQCTSADSHGPPQMQRTCHIRSHMSHFGASRPCTR